MNDDELGTIWKDGRGLNRGAVPEFVWADWEKSRKPSGRIPDGPAESRTRYLQNPILERDRCAKPLDVFHIKMRTQSEGVWEQIAEQQICA
jgi:hypothetical protein